LTNPIVKEELELLAATLLRLAEPQEDVPAAEAALVRDLSRLREIMLEPMKAEDAPALHQQWDQGNALLRQLRASRNAPKVDPSSPYFAHLRLRDSAGERDLFLGRATRIEGSLRIVDWRNAPISKIFYRYGQGDEYEEVMAGRRRAGVVVTRRTVAIRAGMLERVEAPEGVFARDAGVPGGWRETPRERLRLHGGEGAALRAFGPGEGSTRRLGTDLDGRRRRADKRLPELAGLLDPEQFALITRPSSGFVVIRGSAGSGKTTVALHRIAYLAYDDPNVDSDRTLFVVFSPALRSYVSHVLPALGVEHARITTFAEWVSEQRRRLFPRLPRELRAGAPTVVERLKLHPALLYALEEQVRRTPGPGTPAQAFDDWASVLCQAALLEEAVARVAPGAFGAEEMRRAADWNRARHEELTAWLEGDAEVQAELDPEDDALLLRAWQLRVGPLSGRGGAPLRYRHVAIDEVQDFSPVEVRVLIDCLDERRSLTLAGDTQQHVLQAAGFTSWPEFLAHLGLEGTSIDTLRVSYRSTREITSFSREVLGDLAEESEPPLSLRSGPPVECLQFTDPGACVASLADALRALAREEPLASVAVLTSSAALSETYHRGLVEAELPNLRRVAHQDFTFAPGVEVTEIVQAKGLEFDYVILVEVGAAQFPSQPAARRLLHVGATRAVHQLWVTCVGELSPIVREALAKSAGAA
jgi:DNA helicase-2/ATP-dependent DNA helicase PcrA